MAGKKAPKAIILQHSAKALFSFRELSKEVLFFTCFMLLFFDKGKIILTSGAKR
jgi:hypothetical protein